MKTTIIVPDEVWKQFHAKVFQSLGNRKGNHIIVKLIEGYTDGQFKVKA